jgi:hypothetical protein
MDCQLQRRTFWKFCKMKGFWRGREERQWQMALGCAVRASVGSLEFLSGLSPFPADCSVVSLLEQRSPFHIRARTGLSLGHKAVCVCHKRRRCSGIELAVCSSPVSFFPGDENWTSLQCGKITPHELQDLFRKKANNSLKRRCWASGQLEFHSRGDIFPCVPLIAMCKTFLAEFAPKIRRSCHIQLAPNKPALSKTLPPHLWCPPVPRMRKIWNYL